jgi:TPR repeat protein
MGQFEYGKMILHGQVRGKNVQDAIHWLRLAAEQKPDGLVFKEMKNFGVIDAAQKLGELYLAGFNNQPPDYAAALKWYTKAAEAGCAASQKGGLRVCVIHL